MASPLPMPMSTPQILAAARHTAHSLRAVKPPASPLKCPVVASRRSSTCMCLRRSRGRVLMPNARLLMRDPPPYLALKTMASWCGSPPMPRRRVTCSRIVTCSRRMSLLMILLPIAPPNRPTPRPTSPGRKRKKSLSPPSACSSRQQANLDRWQQRHRQKEEEEEEKEKQKKATNRAPFGCRLHGGRRWARSPSRALGRSYSRPPRRLTARLGGAAAGSAEGAADQPRGKGTTSGVCPS